MDTQSSVAGGNPRPCEWFALCTNEAAGVVRHPILGDVPTCQRCADKLGLDLVGGAS